MVRRLAISLVGLALVTGSLAAAGPAMAVSSAHEGAARAAASPPFRPGGVFRPAPGTRPFTSAATGSPTRLTGRAMRSPAARSRPRRRAGPRARSRAPAVAARRTCPRGSASTATARAPWSRPEAPATATGATAITTPGTRCTRERHPHQADRQARRPVHRHRDPHERHQVQADAEGHHPGLDEHRHEVDHGHGRLGRGRDGDGGQPPVDSAPTRSPIFTVDGQPIGSYTASPTRSSRWRSR